MAYVSMMDGLTPPTPLQAAEAAVRDYCGWHVAPVVTEVLTVDADGGNTLFLPTLKLLDVISLTVDGTAVDPAGYSYSEKGMIRLKHGKFPRLFRSVVAEIQHGYAPADVAHIVQQIADRVILAPDAASVFAQVTTGDRQMSYRGTAGSIGLLAMEREMLEPYKLRRLS